jgi:hypothetical protein
MDPLRVTEIRQSRLSLVRAIGGGFVASMISFAVCAHAWAAATLAV